MGFSENLRNIRKERNLSQEQLAELLNISRQSVSKWEQDGSYPETEKLIQIAKKLDVSLDSLLLDKQMATDSTNETPLNYVASSPDRKIFIQSFDGSTAAAFYKFTIHKQFIQVKGEPVCALAGTDKSTFFWGDNLVTLGWYATIEAAQKELAGIYDAIQKGEPSYKLRYYAEVKIKAFSVKLKEKSGDKREK